MNASAFHQTRIHAQTTSRTFRESVYTHEPDVHHVRTMLLRELRSRPTFLIVGDGRSSCHSSCRAASAPMPITILRSVHQHTMSSAIQSALTSLQQNNYVTLAILTVLGYDYALAFSNEIEYIWNKPWTWVSTLYILVRYVGIYNLV
ncbi:hypothetical protein L210DRAFT_3202252 [Boletus edulis BED1]|uniref:DUF6533 domain-containing protein n=1 Tax=Boletus edulis BED1 TaxID=1328754 RepID=A0AAD4BX10_BOLED|nr:hypothetical protein L210DRAFT_3202252 [Boletus edulis BED1]